MPRLRFWRWMVLAWALSAPLGLTFAGRADAQDTVPSAHVPDAHIPDATLGPDSNAWAFSFSPYVWAASQKGRVGVLGSVTDIDLSFGDVVDQVDLGFSALLEARYRRWLGLLDFSYFALTDDQAVPEGAATTGTVQVSVDEVMAQPQIGYTLLVRPWGGVDGLGGVRYWHISSDVTANSSGSQTAVSSGSRGWVDGTVGARLRFSTSPKLHFTVRSDVGGGGSKFTWQAVGFAGYDFGTCCSITGGYRHLDVDYESDEFVYDVYVTGPTLGLTARF